MERITRLRGEIAHAPVEVQVATVTCKIPLNSFIAFMQHLYAFNVGQL